MFFMSQNNPFNWKEAFLSFPVTSHVVCSKMSTTPETASELDLLGKSLPLWRASIAREAEWQPASLHYTCRVTWRGPRPCGLQEQAPEPELGFQHPDPWPQDPALPPAGCGISSNSITHWLHFTAALANSWAFKKPCR